MIPLWAKALILLAAVAGIFHAGRLYERRIWRADVAEQRAHQIQASADQQITSANAGTTTVTEYADRVQSDRAPVERVITRVRNICLREPADHLPVPESAGAVQAPGGQAGDAGDDAFVAALQRDVQTCAAELARLDGSARYLRI